MKPNRQSIRIFAILLLLVGIPNTLSAQMQIEESLDSRIDDAKEKAEALQQKANALRQEMFRLKEKPMEPAQLEGNPVESLPETELDTSDLQKSVEQFREARTEFELTPARLEARKEALERAIDSLKEHAQVLRERTKRFPVIQENLQDALRAEIAADEATLEEFGLKARHAQSTQELKTLAEELRMHRAQEKEQKVRKLMLLAHVDVFEHRVIRAAFERARLVQQRLDAFEDFGKDVAAPEELLVGANQNLREASRELEHIRQNILTADLTDALMQETRQKLQNAKQTVKDAYQIFRTIAKQTTAL